MFFFRSPATQNKTIVRWHAERMARTRQGPFDNVLRPEADFLGCSTPSGERLTGLHFVAWEPWVQLVGPCIRKASRTLASDGVSDWCSAKQGFLDEHLLWLSARLCGLDPGPRMTSATISQERPIHGYHAHSRQLAHPSDRPSVCDVALPFAKRHLRGLALSRFERSARVVGCTRQVQKPGSSEGHSVRHKERKSSRSLPNLLCKPEALRSNVTFPPLRIPDAPPLSSWPQTPQLSVATLILSTPTVHGKMQRDRLRADQTEASSGEVHFIVGRLPCDRREVAAATGKDSQLVVVPLEHDCPAERPRKLRLAYGWALHALPHVSWIIKMDDSAHCCIAALASDLGRLKPSGPLAVHGRWSQERLAGGNPLAFPRGAHAVSRGVAALLCNGTDPPYGHGIGAAYDAEDVALGKWLEHAAVKLSPPIDWTFGRHMVHAERRCFQDGIRASGAVPGTYDQLMIVAHPDDELIWAGEILVAQPGRREILCIVTPWSRSMHRAATFLQSESLAIDSVNTMWQFVDTGMAGKLPWMELCRALEAKLLSRKWSRIVTHGREGEYGHAHHVQVLDAVVEVLGRLELLQKLYVFKPTKTDGSPWSSSLAATVATTYRNHFVWATCWQGGIERYSTQPPVRKT